MSPRFEIDPADDGIDDDLTFDDLVVLALATAMALGLLTSIGLMGCRLRLGSKR